MQSASLPADQLRDGAYYMSDGDIVVSVGGMLFRFHSFHLQRATSHFDRMLAAGTSGSDSNPLVLDDTTAHDFAHLLWFFYESAYKWLGLADPSMTPKWESVLLLAQKFGMAQVARVACHALDRAKALGDVRKVALCTKHDTGKDWVLEELQRLLTRAEPLSMDEADEMGARTTAVLSAAREALHLRPPAIQPPACADVGSKVYPVHAYHLKRASRTFVDMFDLQNDNASTEGKSQEQPIFLNVEEHQFSSFIWFLYDSPYAWSYEANPDLASKWEDILSIGDMFNMSEVCKVATYALDFNGGLPDIRKISLCVRHRITMDWALQAVKRVCTRQFALTRTEARAIGVDMTAMIACVREYMLPNARPNASHSTSISRPQRSLIYYHDEGDIVLRRSSSYFNEKLRSSADTSIAGAGPRSRFTDDNPFTLDNIESSDFECLLWFFYESAYHWSAAIVTSLTDKWEAILTLAEHFSMRQIAKVACLALDRADVLSDVRKIALCAKHDMGEDWIFDEVERVLSREEALSMYEGKQLGVDLAMIVAATRERLRLENIILPMPCTYGVRCLSCSYTAKCAGGTHVCCGPYGGAHHASLCPALTDINHASASRDSESFMAWEDSGVYHDAQSRAASVEPDQSWPTTDCRAQGDIFVKVEDSTYQVHSYHLRRASMVFADMFQLPTDGSSAEGTNTNQPITLDVKKYDFESLLWFFYESPYQWSYKANPTLASRWESILSLADMFSMEDVCRVATYALDVNGGLTDTRKISLSVRHSIDPAWAMEAFKRVCIRREPITEAEACDMGPRMTALVTAAREEALRTHCSYRDVSVLVNICGGSDEYAHPFEGNHSLSQRP
ncbi:hypothetical protein HDZ31DRAFT_28333 [Schizophyllum fasciatum]